VRAAAGSTGAGVDDFYIVAAGDRRERRRRTAGVVHRLASPACGLGVVGGLVLALGVAWDMGLVELVGVAADGDLHEGHLARVTPSHVGVGWEDGGILSVGHCVVARVRWPRGVVWMVRVVDERRG